MLFLSPLVDQALQITLITFIFLQKKKSDPIIELDITFLIEVLDFSNSTTPIS